MQSIQAAHTTDTAICILQYRHNLNGYILVPVCIMETKCSALELYDLVFQGERLGHVYTHINSKQTS